jgi:hypothetical protein
MIKDGGEDGITAMVQQLIELEEEETDEKKTYRRHKFRGNMMDWIDQRTKGNSSYILKVMSIYQVLCPENLNK